MRKLPKTEHEPNEVCSKSSSTLKCPYPSGSKKGGVSSAVCPRVLSDYKLEQEWVGLKTSVSSFPQTLLELALFPLLHCLVAGVLRIQYFPECFLSSALGQNAGPPKIFLEKKGKLASRGKLRNVFQ